MARIRVLVVWFKPRHELRPLLFSSSCSQIMFALLKIYYMMPRQVYFKSFDWQHMLNHWKREQSPCRFGGGNISCVLELANFVDGGNFLGVDSVHSSAWPACTSTVTWSGPLQTYLNRYLMETTFEMHNSRFIWVLNFRSKSGEYGTIHEVSTVRVLGIPLLNRDSCTASPPSRLLLLL